MTTRARAAAVVWALGALSLLAPDDSHATSAPDGAAPPPITALASTELARHVEREIAGLDYDEARRDLRLAEGLSDDPKLAVERARLALYELDCDGAAAILAAHVPEGDASGDGAMLSEIARGCQRVIASLASSKDEARGIEVRWQDEHDAPLAPAVFETVARARVALSRDLGVDWPLPTRIVVVRDLLSLSAMTGLPYDSARTTGTVAVAKWGRVTLLSPRAAPHGFPWRDTLAHELTHLAVTRATGDRAPLWLQEGVAKRGETRWRPRSPFDDRPPVDSVVQSGIDRGLAIPLDKLGPSIAMLPSADAAMVAFAEVTSFVRFYLEREGDDGLPKLFHFLKEGEDPNAAMVSASGADLKTWDTRWRASIAARPRADASLDPPRRELSANAARDLRDRARLTELLLARRHASAGLDELSHVVGLPESGRTPPAPAKGAPGDDPSLLWLEGRALEMATPAAPDGPGIAPLVADPAAVSSSVARWWALRGRWQRASGDEAGAAASFSAAFGDDPFEREVACDPGARGPAGQAQPGPALDGLTLPPGFCASARAGADGPPYPPSIPVAGGNAAPGSGWSLWSPDQPDFD